MDRKEIKIKIIETSDIHGNYFPYDFIEKRKSEGGLSSIASYIKEQRGFMGENLLLLDNGDIIQGQPTAYYYNFIDTKSEHLCARILNYLKYDGACIGNHDIEAGKEVYDRLVKESDFPWLSANAVKDKDGKTYFKPYTIKNISGIKIAVLGITTPAIPNWLPKSLYPEMHFEDAEKCAQGWIEKIKEIEKPDIILGLFHLGFDSNPSDAIEENGGGKIAKGVSGIDILLLGHDHRMLKTEVVNRNGDTVYVLNPGPFGNFIAEADIDIVLEGGRLNNKKIETRLVDMKKYRPDKDYLKNFRPDYKSVSSFVAKKLGSFSETIYSREAYLGPSFFVDIIHKIQLETTNADISFAAPLSYNTIIKKGNITVSDLFKLYRYENTLYTMQLSGQEIKKYLEYSYSLWCNVSASPHSHLLLITFDKERDQWLFKNPNYDFDSAAGISYTVDIRKPYGQKILIRKVLKNGKIFSPDACYKVAVNSFRGNGGGYLLTKGAEIPHAEIKSRILQASSMDLRYYLMQYISKLKIIRPSILSGWKFIPEEWVKESGQRDIELLFPS